MKLLFVLLIFSVGILHAENVKIHFIGASQEYKAEDSLKVYKEKLEKKFKVSVSSTYTKDKSKTAPNFEMIKEADVLVVFARRLNLSKENLAILKEYLESGKPVVGIRTASHAFQNFLELDSKYFGGSYKGHGKSMQVSMSTAKMESEILKGIKVDGWVRKDKPYYNDSNSADIKILLKGTEPGGRVHPMAWSRVKGQQRLFYTSLGLPEDFKDERFISLLNNALVWVTNGKLVGR